MSVIEALRAARRLRHERLNVKHFIGGGAVWIPEHDVGWQQYRRAMDILYARCPRFARLAHKRGWI